MEHLPKEILEAIFHFCEAEAIVQAACCSKQMHLLLTPILWRVVRIPLSDLLKHGLKQQMMENLKYTTHLRIANSHSDLYDSDTEDEDAEDDRETEMFKKGLDGGFILSKLLNFCDPLKVTFLGTDIGGKSLEFVLEYLCHVRTLVLQSVDDDAASKVKELLNLEEVRMDCSLLTGTGFKDIMNVQGLRVLSIRDCQKLPNDALKSLSEKQHLEQLSLYSSKSIFSSEEMIDISPLCSLKNLTDLTLSAKLRNDQFKELCRCLTQLKSLDLMNSRISDEGLTKMSSLSCLEELDITYVKGITWRCLGNLPDLPLRKISFSFTICSSSSDRDDIKNEICMLSQVPTLQKVTVINLERQGGQRMLMIVNSMCSEDSWTMKYKGNRTNGINKYIFTRCSCV